MKNKLRFKLKSNIKDKNFKGTVKIGLLCVYDTDILQQLKQLGSPSLTT